jgi:hypothetical protein
MIGYLLLIHVGKEPDDIWMPLMVDLNADLPEESYKQGTFFYLHSERSSDELKHEMDLFIKNNPNYAHSELKWQKVQIHSIEG